MLFELVVYFSLAVGTTSLVAMPGRMVRVRWWLAVPVMLAAVAGAAAAAWAILRDPSASEAFSVLLVVATVIARVGLGHRRWSWLASQLFVAVVLASLSYLAYAAFQTYSRGLPPAVVVLSTLLLLLEVCALALAISYAFEVVDVLGRRDGVPAQPEPTVAPWVALQVATYNEPVELLSETLTSLANLEYPNFLVQVVDNNTTDPALWRPLEELCRRLGPRFQFMHLEPWPGFKAGALNEATRRLPPEIEIISIIDADYIVRPDFLRHMVGHFDDPQVAFAQSSQNYRDWRDSSYLRGLFYSFRYFFDVTMTARAHRNAIIFCGTMGLIRRSVLDEIGGWDETCITEDAEASLRMLGRGYSGVYDRRAYGAGIMPLDFSGLKKQRFRWAFGGMQILRMWWRELLPFAPHRLRLTRAQRAHYLLGSLQWFAEPLTWIFTILLLATALASSLHHALPIRQLTAGVLAVPIVFAVTGLARAMWAMRRMSGCSWKDALGALRAWFALSWVVTLACMRGFVRKSATFLRTPKHKEGTALLRALWSSSAESVIALCATAGAVAMVVRSPSFATGALGALLLFEAYVYASAPVASVAAERVPLNHERRLWLASAQNTGDRPPRAGRRAAVGFAGVLALAGVAGVTALVLTAPAQPNPFAGQGTGDLPRLNALAPAIPTVSAPTPSPSVTASPSPSSVTSPTASPTSQPTSTPTPTTAPTPTPAPTPSAPPAPTPT